MSGQPGGRKAQARHGPGTIPRLRAALCLGLSLAGGCAGDTTAPPCGAPTADRFSIVIRKTLIAPYDFAGEPWDRDGDIGDWQNDYGRFVEAALSIASKGNYELGTIDRAIDLSTQYPSTLFSPSVTPDPVIELWFLENAASEWEHLGGWYALPGDTNLVVGLEAGDFTFGAESTVWLSYYEKDLDVPVPVGVVYFTRDIARSMADCGPLSYIYSPAAMDISQTRIQAVEVQVTSDP